MRHEAEFYCTELNQASVKVFLMTWQLIREEVFNILQSFWLNWFSPLNDICLSASEKQANHMLRLVRCGRCSGTWVALWSRTQTQKTNQGPFKLSLCDISQLCCFGLNGWRSLWRKRSPWAGWAAHSNMTIWHKKILIAPWWLAALSAYKHTK